MVTLVEVLGKAVAAVNDAAGVEHSLYPLTLDDLADIESERGTSFLNLPEWLIGTAQGQRAVLWRSMRAHGLTDKRIEECSASGEWPISRTAVGRMFLGGQVEEIIKLIPKVMEASGFRMTAKADPPTAVAVTVPATVIGLPASPSPESALASLPEKSAA